MKKLTDMKKLVLILGVCLLAACGDGGAKKSEAPSYDVEFIDSLVGTFEQRTERIFLLGCAGCTRYRAATSFGVREAPTGSEQRWYHDLTHRPLRFLPQRT